jgi:hypothetical protein
MPAYYRATVGDFLSDSDNLNKVKSIIGQLTASYADHGFVDQKTKQTKAWLCEIEVLKIAFSELLRNNPDATKWSLLLEYPIPRREKRLDGVILAEDLIFCLEFKTLDKKHSALSQRQVEEYALDLRDFHEASKDRCILPIVIVPKANSKDVEPTDITDSVRQVRLANAKDLARTLQISFETEHRNGSPRLIRSCGIIQRIVPFRRL